MVHSSRAENEKSSDWSDSARAGTGNETSGKGGGRAANDKPPEGSRFNEENRSRQEQEGRSAAINITATTLRSLGQFYDMQAAATRIMLRSQMRAASRFGFPDYSRIFEIGDERTQHLCSSATENLVQFVARADSPLIEIPSQVCRLLERQAVDMTERWKSGLEELRQQTTDSMEEFKELARQQVEELDRISESLSDAAQQTLSESGQQLRSAARQGREMARQQGDTMRQEGERMAGEVRGAAQESGRDVAEGNERASRTRHSRAA